MDIKKVFSKALFTLKSLPGRFSGWYNEIRSNTEKRKKLIRQSIRFFLVGTGVLFLLIGILFITVWAGWFGKLPTKRELAAVENQLSSEVLDIDGKLIGKYFIYDRSHARLDQVSKHVTDCLIATEDTRFYNHGGIDFISLGRVLVKSILLGQESSGGGSTISQQLAKNLFSRGNNGLLSMPVNKAREMIIARRLERIYSKQDILALYLNTVPFGENVYGISAASLRFFNKNPRDLKLEEAAVLVGMLKATTYFNPRTQPERATARRNIVLGQLARYEYVSPEQADSLKQLSLVIDYNPITHNQGPAPYFRETLRMQITKLIDQYNQRNQTDYNLYTDGLKIYTTIDYDLQLQAETALKNQLSRQQKMMEGYYKNVTRQPARNLLQSLMRNSHRYKSLQNQKLQPREIQENFNRKTHIDLFSWDGPKRSEISPLDSIFLMQQVLHGAMISIDPRNGQVRAWVGGNDFRFFQFDHVLAKRQAGSAFKPFVYATALSQGFSPCEFVSNQQRVYEDYDDWNPANARGEYEGYYSMAGALANSINTVTAWYMDQIGPDAVAETAMRCGIGSYLQAVPSLALGTSQVSLLELTASYSVFLNNGRPIEPVWLLKIEDKNGKVLYERKDQDMLLQPVIEPSVAIITRSFLQAVPDSGTARSLRYAHQITADIAGKTGTTQNGADTWFIGFSTGLITGVWTGVENPGFAQLYKTPVNSGNSAVPLWGDYYGRISRNSATRKYVQGSFAAIPDSIQSNLNCPMFVTELPRRPWWEDILNPPSDKPRRPEHKPENLFKRWIESIL